MLGDGGATELEPVAELPGGKLLARQNLPPLSSHRIRQDEKKRSEVATLRHYMSEIPDTPTTRVIADNAKLLTMRFAWERLTPSVYRCRVPFCDVTVGLIRGRDGALLVDTATTLTEAGAIEEDVRQLTTCSVTHIVLTHKHFDHVLGSSFFTDAEIHCAPEVADYLTTAHDQIRADALGYGADAAEIDRAIAALRPPRRGLYDAVIDLGDRDVRVTHPGRGHTTSDLIVVVPGLDDHDRHVVFAGDLVEESADPAIDADSDVAAWPATLDRVRAIGGHDAIYVPGHGKIVDADFIRRQRAWLQQRSS
ncbi:metallo-beta-lactamase [Mycobacterium triplex]|uniref:Metallo-beta-lactamase n=2 Tax=Mycobacterium triplex TaxID=47839 RepID=A0A024JZ99_9MYCO|nr:metallo-beta-lactamase [Mycobacterium triplex]